ncbi:hypothetical protein B0J12DRAFT_656800 [Macrophomina phaseolina]|uniref:Uncharacterized protein n=1 Tax=Macrophomina phaseolina TaxID=35725 RepID=A0ABQ8GHL1_9PEZI|nr:hypothetical protein B0J12DRAFT_656800 [Macrophomina phaseolina]
MEQVRGVERSGMWCRVRRGWGGGGGHADEKRKTGVGLKEVAEGDLGVEGRNWVRNASGQESVSEGDEAAVVREREDSGVELEMKDCRVSMVESSSGSSEARQSRLLAMKKGLLLPSWDCGPPPKTSSSSQQSILEAVLAAGKVTPLLSQHQQQGGDEQCLRAAASPIDDTATAAGYTPGLSRSGTIVVRRSRSVEEQHSTSKTPGIDGQEDRGERSTDVGLGVSCLIGVGSSTSRDEPSTQVVSQQRPGGRSLDVKRVPRAKRRTVGQV